MWTVHLSFQYYDRNLMHTATSPTHAATVTEFICVPALWIEGFASLVSPSPSSSYIITVSSSAEDPGLRGEELNGNLTFPYCHDVSQYLHIAWLRVSIFGTTCSGRKLLW